MMKMTKLTTLFLTATLTLASGAALAADQAQGSANGNGQANAAADAGAVAPGAHENIAPNNVDNNQINTGNSSTGGTMLHPNGTSSTMDNHDGMTKDEVHKNSMCKDGKCPDMNNKVDNDSNDAERKTDGTTQ